MAELSDIFPINIWFYISCFDENVFQTLTKTSKIFRQFASKNKHLVYKKFGQVQPIDKNEECGIGFKWTLFGNPNRLGNLPIKLGDMETCWNVRYGKPSSIGRRGTMEIEYGDYSIRIYMHDEYEYVDNRYEYIHGDSAEYFYRWKGNILPDMINRAVIHWNNYESNYGKSIYVTGSMWFENRKNNAPENLHKDGTFE